MIHGALLPKLLLFSLPLMLSGCLQLAFNAADVIVVGRFAGDAALAAVGSTTSLVNLLTNVFIGLSVGANVIMAHDWGAQAYNDAQETIATAITMSLLSGVALIFVGLFFARPLLVWMGSPADVLDLSVLYIRVFFLGMPMTMVYNFGSALLRAFGDTRRPLYYLTLAGCINVPLNLLFVIVFHMSVAGVALATIIAQTVSAALVVRCLMRLDGPCKLDIKNLRINKHKLLRMLRIGLPAGIQGSLFSLSNVLIQSSVNSFGSIIMAGNAAANSVEGFIYTAMNAIHQAAVSFTSQNMGAGLFKRIDKIAIECYLLVTVIGLSLGVGALMAGEVLLGFYSTEYTVVAAGMVRLKITCTAYFLCGLMDAAMGVMRGMGYSVTPMLVSLTGACAFRIVWLNTFFKWEPLIKVLYWSYPVSWFLTFVAHVVCYLVVRPHIHEAFHKGVRKQRRLENEKYKGIRPPRTLHRLFRH
ncbi:MAG: MATE family efflux transporter [Butyricicoccus sp.]|nr:MATE family efflux transporter [Butyricicoccus sp.]